MNFNKKDAVADAVDSVLQQEALKGNQKKIDKNHNNRIDSDDFKILRGEKKVAEEIDVNDASEDDISGQKKIKRKDDVGPSGNFKSSKVRFHAGPKNESLEQPLEKVLADTAPHSGIIKTVMATDDLGDTNKTLENKTKLKMKEGFTLKSFKERYEEHSIIDQMINEVLSKDASAGDWIHDFVHSDNPKFAGKSKEMRKKMALAAYYAKQRNEEVEQVDEDRYDDMLNDMLKGKNGKRLLKKHSDEVKKSRDIESGKALQKHVEKNPGVLKTYSNAVKRDKKLYGEEVEQVDEGKGNVLRKQVTNKYYRINKKMGKLAKSHGRTDINTGLKKSKFDAAKDVREEVEQIDEEQLKTKTVHVPYVYTDHHGSGFGGFDVHYSKEADAHAHVARHGHKEINGKKGWVEKHEIAQHPETGRWVHANVLRRHGTGTGMHEEVEKVEEGWDDMMKAVKARSGPQPSGGSGVKLGSRYGGGKQKEKPEQEEEPKKKVNESKRPEDDSVPFAPPYHTSSDTVTDKSGAQHTPMSRAKHLARLAMKRVKKDLGKK